jgi:hypothetical protein
MLSLLQPLYLSMVLNANVPGTASQNGRALGVTPAAWTRVEDANWRLVKTQDRDPQTGRADPRWRVDSDSVNATCRHFNVSLVPNPGLGILLGEMLLGSDEYNSAPLVLVDGIVDGGAAAVQAAEMRANNRYAYVMPGDSLIAVYGSSPETSLIVEAASYETTVDAIGSVLGTLAPGEPLTLTLGRIVRRGRAIVSAVE